MKLSDDLPRSWILLKGALFAVLCVLALGLIVLERPSLRLALLLGIALWAGCRFYYFMFYVIERYVDPQFRFSGVFSFLRWMVRSPIRNPLAQPKDDSRRESRP